MLVLFVANKNNAKNRKKVKVFYIIDYRKPCWMHIKSVILSKGVIAGIHDADFKVPDEILTIDRINKYLILGLINLHVHINRRNVSRTNGTFR